MKVTKEKLSAVISDVVRDPRMTEEVFRENEIQANLLIAKSMLIGAAMLVAFWILNCMGVLAISQAYVLLIFPVSISLFVIAAGIALMSHGEKRYTKYMLLVTTTLTLAYLDGELTFNAPLLIVLPVVFSCRYYSGSITIQTALLTTILFTISAWCGAVFNFDNPDMNFANDDMAIYVRDVMMLSFLPRWMTFAVFVVFCYAIAKYGRAMVIKQNEISQKAAKVSTELEMAARIQNGALPAVENLEKSQIRDFDLSADMTPAKEVGGDFYDFFYPDEKHLALIIADVADKGVAASLFMMMSKTMMGSAISNTLSPGKVLENVNEQLYANSPEGMFVTVWLGILDLETGELVSANAGHEYPVLCRKGGEFELVKDKHGFVLGGMDGMIFKETRYQLEAGDTIFVYTDGVPEANNADAEMFGTEQMVESLNRYRECDMNGLVEGIRNDIEIFVAGAPQFDDTTMLAFRLKERL